MAPPTSPEERAKKAADIEAMRESMRLQRAKAQSAKLSTTIDFAVGMSESKLVSKKFSIGTDGCGTCVGVIIVFENDVFCGHMSCDNIVQQPQIGQYADEAVRVLEAALQKVGFSTNSNIKSVGLTTTGADNSTTAIMKGFKAIVPPTSVVEFKTTGIFWTGSEILSYINTMPFAPGQEKGTPDFKI